MMFMVNVCHHPIAATAAAALILQAGTMMGKRSRYSITISQIAIKNGTNVPVLILRQYPTIPGGLVTSAHIFKDHDTIIQVHIYY